MEVLMGWRLRWPWVREVLSLPALSPKPAVTTADSMPVVKSGVGNRSLLYLRHKDVADKHAIFYMPAMYTVGNVFKDKWYAPLRIDGPNTQHQWKMRDILHITGNVWVESLDWFCVEIGLHERRYHVIFRLNYGEEIAKFQKDETTGLMVLDYQATCVMRDKTLWVCNETGDLARQNLGDVTVEFDVRIYLTYEPDTAQLTRERKTFNYAVSPPRVMRDGVPVIDPPMASSAPGYLHSAALGHQIARAFQADAFVAGVQLDVYQYVS